ncbi:MAG: spermidine/putrescine ABC transporter substrate-binding protein [Victivallales bacterium]|nr:spermidine/putrescine ABC transporter substrate-binding protein [Victivallales bacterium]
MKKSVFVLIALLVASLAAFVGCFGSSKQTLHLYCWADYISPELIEAFEKENNCRVVYDTFDSNEALLAKLQAGASGYDIIFPSHYVVDSLASSGKLQKLDHSKLTIMNHLDPEVLAQLPDKQCEYVIPYMMSYTGIGYNKDVIKDFEPSWKMFERNDLQKRATLLDDKREVIGAALLYLGLDPNSINADDLAKAKALIKQWLANVSKLENEQYKNGIASKEFSLVMGYSGDMVQVVDENPHVAFVLPKEGVLMSCDVLAIPSTAKNVDLAYKFINFIHTPENAASNTEYVFYLCPNKDAYSLLPEEIKHNPAVFIDKDIFEKSRFTIDHGEQEVILNKLWEELKAGR